MRDEAFFRGLPSTRIRFFVELTPSGLVVTFVSMPNIKGLRAELGREKGNADRLEADAVEMRERLKKLDKYEKNEKGHNAMTEELKRMEKETGLSVSTYCRLMNVCVDIYFRERP